MSVQKTDSIARQLDSFSGLLQEISRKLTPFDDCVDRESFAQLRKSFQNQTEDFFSANRKFNLAVLGQVKAGKSSFLNMLLFDGRQVLPRAATPKTSALTRIEYAPQNHLTVEYMTPAEWIDLRRLAASAMETPQVCAAREAIALATRLGTPVERCLATGQEIIQFKDDAELNRQLDNYVGEAGVLTPMVKYVTLGLALDCLKNLSVTDTPGLNDPISSRTQRTRQFISQCDAAFFLSRGSYFLDQNDLQLLTSQLPQKGVGRLILVASQYDSALMDTIGDYGSLEQADLETKLALRRHTANHVEDVIRGMRRTGEPQNIIKVIEQCHRPIFISVVAQMMASKSPETYTDTEQIVQKQLSRYAPVTAETLMSMGNFSEVRKIFDNLIAEKEILLQHKAEAFVVTAQSDLRLWLASRKIAAQTHKAQLANSIQQLEQRQLQLSQRINVLQAAIASEVNRHMEPIDGALTHAVFELNRMQSEWNNPPTRAELAVHTFTKTVSAFRWNHPGSWGKHYQRYFSEEILGEVLDPKEMKGYLVQFWTAASDLCAGTFTALEDLSPLTNALYHIVDEQFARSSAIRQPERLSSLVSHTLSVLNVQLPIPEPDPNRFLLAEFSSPVRATEEQEKLRRAVKSAIAHMTDDLRHYLLHSAAALKEAGQHVTELLQKELGEEMIEWRASFRSEQTALEGEYIRCQELIELLEWYL